MSQTNVVHDTFTLERTLDATPARVFEALSKPEVKARWFAGPPSWKQHERSMDFRVGGRERLAGEHAGGMTSVFDAIYLDIVQGERLVYAYEMTVNGRKISTSLATFVLVPEGKKTRLVLTEQGAYFHDPSAPPYPGGARPEVSRAEGTRVLMDQIAALFAA